MIKKILSVVTFWARFGSTLNHDSEDILGQLYAFGCGNNLGKAPFVHLHILSKNQVWHSKNLKKSFASKESFVYLRCN